MTLKCVKIWLYSVYFYEVEDHYVYDFSVLHFKYLKFIGQRRGKNANFATLIAVVKFDLHVKIITLL